MSKGLIFNIQRFSVHDGPGIRTAVFFKGCPLRCRWCHNPEGFSGIPELEYNAVKCIGCGRCRVCPNGCHSVSDGIHSFDRSRCVRCFACVDACPAGALLRAGKEYTVDEVIKAVEADIPFYKNSGGGMTLSGGEPLMQSEFAIELLKSAKARSIDTAIETSGFVSAEVIEAAAPYVDRFLYDYKITDPEDHKKYTGVDREPIMNNLRLLDSLGAVVVLRCPIVPGVNDVDGHFDAIASLSAELSCVVRVDLEPYHELGTAKYAKFGREVSFSVSPPEKEYMEAVRETIQNKTPKRVIIS